MKLKNPAFLVFVAVIALSGCSPSRPLKEETPFSLESLMRSRHGLFDSVLANKNQFNLQVIYTTIDRDKDGRASFTDHYYDLDSGIYFYPASTIKLPVALLALEKLNDLRINGLDRGSVMITDSSYPGQTVVYNDPTSATGAPTIDQYIRKIFLVSDNDAFNRLYEFLGRGYINKRLHEMGYSDVQVLHRLGVFLSQDENRHTNPVRFFDQKGSLLYAQPMQFDQQWYETRNDSAGNGYMTSSANGLDSLVNRPMNFSLKNRISLSSLHTILKFVYFPENFDARNKFRLTDSDLKFVRKYMSMLPRESKYPLYDSSEYPDAFCKFLLFGAEKGSWPSGIRVFNKVGDAYGYLLDVAYVVDLDKKIEFMLSAVMYCNKDGILNDDKYDYNTIGLPFFRELGKAVYEYELKRKKKHLPDLEYLRMKYVE